MGRAPIATRFPKATRFEVNYSRRRLNYTCPEPVGMLNTQRHAPVLIAKKSGCSFKITPVRLAGMKSARVGVASNIRNAMGDEGRIDWSVTGCTPTSVMQPS